MKITVKSAEAFDTTEGQLKSTYQELSELSRKKPDGPVSKFKIALINEILTAANALLGDAGLPFKDFRAFDVDVLPSASDCVLVLAQYRTAMSRFRYENTRMRDGEFWWISEGHFIRPTVGSTYKADLRGG